ncbi:MAG: bifunctional phosphoribosylaminoimidazolecarboxamide formyltransferase/IMP cyclohydrolase [Bacteroidota bacterium]
MALKPLNSLPETSLKPTRALLSVSDKTGITELAMALNDHGVELISTGGTAKVIKEAGIPVKDVSEITHFEECLDGRVKTLHPVIHGGILGRTSYEPDVKELGQLGISPIDLVVVNLYPFQQTVAQEGVTLATATEYIDIGGPTMIRAAAKNFAHVCVLSNPAQYATVIEELSRDGGISFPVRQFLAKEAFNHTAQYDAAIANYFNSLDEVQPPAQINISTPKSQELRYGENPHQKAAVYGVQDQLITCFHGKQLSYNNYLDVDAALTMLADFRDADPTCIIIKHTVPCGVGTASQLSNAYQRAFATDTVSPFGGIVAVNKALDLETAQAIDQIFTEIIIAPSFNDDAKELLIQKKNRRLIELNENWYTATEYDFRSIFGGALYQQKDRTAVSEQELSFVTRRKPTEEELKDALFAWKVVRHVKSNAIVYARDGATLGIGTGQTSRVDSSEIAIAKARKEGLSLQNAIIASDAFFPFADGVEAAAKAGATVVIQPGGSVRDEEVIAKADAHHMAMIFTGKRHFKH